MVRFPLAVAQSPAGIAAAGRAILSGPAPQPAARCLVGLRPERVVAGRTQGPAAQGALELLAGGRQAAARRPARRADVARRQRGRTAQRAARRRRLARRGHAGLRRRVLVSGRQLQPRAAASSTRQATSPARATPIWPTRIASSCWSTSIATSPRTIAWRSTIAAGPPRAAGATRPGIPIGSSPSGER